MAWQVLLAGQRLLDSQVWTMDNDLASRPILEWDPADVHRWLSSIGFSQYENPLKGVSGFPVELRPY